MAKASRKLLLALLTIAVCIALLVAGTYALFSTQIGVENHLVAGNISATLTRTKLQTVTLATNGHLTSTVDDADKDFTDATSDNLFGLDGNEKIAPGCSFTADMLLANNGSVAFSYWIEVKLNGDSNALAEQLTVTVKAGTITRTQSLSAGLTVGNDKTGLAIVEVGGSTAFSVTVAFKDDAANNGAMDQEAELDLIVHAIQDATIS